MEHGAPFVVSGTAVLDALRQPWRGLWQRRARSGAAILGEAVAGHGQPALVLPMLGAGQESTARLRGALSRRGFSSHDWGYGTDTGPSTGSLDNRLRHLEERVIDIFETEHRTVTLIGWGLSGIYARELAKRVAPLVRQVITLGTPFNTTAGSCAMLDLLKQPGSGLLPDQLRERPPVPCTSIYSMSDRAVPWPMCVETASARSESLLVPVPSHRHLADHPRVREIIVDRLAQPEGRWRPFRG